MNKEEQTRFNFAWNIWGIPPTKDSMPMDPGFPLLFLDQILYEQEISPLPVPVELKDYTFLDLSLVRNEHSLLGSSPMNPVFYVSKRVVPIEKVTRTATTIDWHLIAPSISQPCESPDQIAQDLRKNLEAVLAANGRVDQMATEIHLFSKIGNFYDHEVVREALKNKIDQVIQTARYFFSSDTPIIEKNKFFVQTRLSSDSIKSHEELDIFERDFRQYVETGERTELSDIGLNIFLGKPTRNPMTTPDPRYAIHRKFAVLEKGPYLIHDFSNQLSEESYNSMRGGGNLKPENLAPRLFIYPTESGSREQKDSYSLTTGEQQGLIETASYLRKLRSAWDKVWEPRYQAGQLGFLAHIGDFGKIDQLELCVINK